MHSLQWKTKDRKVLVDAGERESGLGVGFCHLLRRGIGSEAL